MKSRSRRLCINYITSLLYSQSVPQL